MDVYGPIDANNQTLFVRVCDVPVIVMMSDECCVMALLVCSGEQRGFLMRGLLTSCL